MGFTPSLKRYMSQSEYAKEVLMSSLVGLRNWKSYQNYFISEKVVTSRRLEEYYYLFILSMSCTQRVKALDNLKLDIL